MIRSLLNYVRRRVGSDLSDVPAWQLDIVRRVSPYTMTSPERVLATIGAVDYIVLNDIPGAIAECGVWKGGSMMAAALTLLRYPERRPIYLFDTFEGMTAPDGVDVDADGRPAATEFARSQRKNPGERWCESSIDEVRANMDSTGYPADLLHFVRGPVEDTLPGNAPEAISLLRLDTDWHASTLHELIELYPRVVRLGVIIIDDYGYWRGAKEAVDAYLAEHRVPALLHRIDQTGRMFVKP